MAYIGNVPSHGEFKKADSIASSFNGSLTAFDLDVNAVNQTVGDASQLIVSLNGIVQEPGTAYTLGIGGGSVVFASAPASTDTCHIVILGGVGDSGTPADGSITAVKLAPDLRDLLEEEFTGDGSATTFTMARAVSFAKMLLITIDGVVQPTSAYSVSGTTLTISPALPNTTNVRVLHIGIPGAFNSAGTVTASMISSTGGTANQVLAVNSGGSGIEFQTVSGGGSALTVQEEGSSLSTAATTLNFVGTAVTASGTGATKTITIASGGLSDVVSDTTPQLGGTLDANSNTIDMGTNILTDANLGQFITAHGWGNHASGGYQTTSGLNAAIDTHVNQSNPTSGHVLSWNGSDYAWVANTGGGGGADLYAANESSPSAQPSSTGTNAIAIGDAAVSTGTNSFALGKSRASGTDSFAAAIDHNTTTYGAQGTNSVAIGKNAKCTNTGFAIGYMTQSIVAGASVLGFGSIGSGSNSTALGNYAKASGFASIAIGCEPSGYYTEASAQYSVAIGNRALSAITGKLAYTGRAFSDNGDAQQGTFVLLSDTTDATAEALTTNKSTAGTTNQINLANNSAYTFSGTIVAREKASEGTDVGSWEVKGIIRREANAGTTVLVNSVINEFNAPTGWAVALTADTTLGCLKIAVTGVASTNIRWVATIQTSEVMYA